jgi:hypothetical protein
MTRKFSSIAVQGYVVKAYKSVILRPCDGIDSVSGGLLRATNTSSIDQTIMPSGKAQAQYPGFIPEIVGDSSGFASKPLAWENPLIKFEVLMLPKHLLPGQSRALPPAIATEMTSKMFSMVELVSLVPAPIGSQPPGPDNPKNYMGFDRTNWEVFHADIVDILPDNVDHVVGNHVIQRNEHAFLLHVLGKHIAFVVKKYDGVVYTNKQDALGIFLDTIGTTGCISLLQKAIRRQPMYLSHPDTNEQYSSREVVVRISKRMLAGKQNGFFLPRIGRYVTALQHFLKRLFIIAAEDSVYDESDMHFVSMHALLSYTIPFWKPSGQTVDRFVSIAVKLLESKYTSNYPVFNEKRRVDRDMSKSFKINAPSLVHEYIGGMGGDQDMLRWLSQSARNNVRAPQDMSGVDTLDVFCDQHQDGRLVCFLEQRGRTFSEQLSRAFLAVSGHNTRRRPRTTPSFYEKTVFDALRMNSAMVRGKVPPFPSTVGPSIVYDLPLESIAGMVGNVEISLRGKSGKFYATVSSRNIANFVVVRKPGRKKENDSITPETRDIVISELRKRLSSGIPVKNSIDKAFKHKKIYLKNNIWYIGNVPWLSARRKSYILRKAADWQKIHERIVPDYTTFIEPMSVSDAVKQFVLGRMIGFERTVKIPKINRTGNGTDEALTGLEALAWQYLHFLSKHFPDALWQSKKPFTFETRSLELRQRLCNQIRGSIMSMCEYPVFNLHQTLRPHQQVALNELLRNDSQGYANFLWMLVGQGKTLTVLRFLEATRKCRFIVWCVPKSGVASVASQIASVGWMPLLLYPSRGTLKNSMLEYPKTLKTRLRQDAVTIIEHDHLRLLVDQLAGQMCDSAFIFDEVHKAMASTTKRTTTALRLGRIAKQIVLLTGTPIVNKTAYGLMEWLRLCVPFPVSPSNFWAAANSMVTSLNTGSVTVKDIVHIVKGADREELFFKNHFPTRMPWQGRNPSQPSIDEWRTMRKLSQDIVDRRIIQLVVWLYRNHPADWRSDHVSAVQMGANAKFDNSSQRPLVVTENARHTVKLVNAVCSQNIQPSDILVVGGGRPASLREGVVHKKTVHLTENAVMEGIENPFRMVFVSKGHCEGFSLTWFTCMVTGLYPNNQANRSQMRGRLNRLDAQRLVKTYIKILAGVTTITDAHAQEAAMIESVLKGASVVAALPQKRKRLTDAFRNLRF